MAVAKPFLRALNMAVVGTPTRAVGAIWESQEGATARSRAKSTIAAATCSGVMSCSVGCCACTASHLWSSAVASVVIILHGCEMDGTKVPTQ